MQTPNYCAGLRSFSNLPEREFYLFYLVFIPAGIRVTWPNSGLYFKGNEENLKLSFLFNWEPMQGCMGVMLAPWLVLVSSVACIMN